jgi:hypothetical protein
MKTRSRQVFLERRHANRAKRVRHTVARALGERAIPCSGGYERRPAAYFAQRKPAAEASPMLFGAPF